MFTRLSTLQLDANIKIKSIIVVVTVAAISCFKQDVVILFPILDRSERVVSFLENIPLYLFCTIKTDFL